MSSLFSGYASLFTEQIAGRFLTSSAKEINDNVVEASSNQIAPMFNDQTFDLLKKFMTYTTISTLVASSAFYIGYNYAKQRNRFDPRSREDDKTDQVNYSFKSPPTIITKFHVLCFEFRLNKF